MGTTSKIGTNNDVELRRIEADLAIRRAELEEKKAQRLADGELKRLEIENSAGRGIRFTSAQATVAAAVIALVSGIVGGLIQAWQSGNVEKIKADGLVVIEQNKSVANIQIEKARSEATIALEKLRFVTSLVAKATETSNRDEQIRNLQFYATAGFIEEPYATKILHMSPDQYPSSTPPGLTAPSADAATSRLAEIFGPPSRNVGQECGPVENDSLKSLLVKDKVGPFTATMLKPALLSLQGIFSEIQKADPDLLKNVSFWGTICVRYKRNSSSLSEHAFGTAIDLQFDEKPPSSSSLSDGTAKQARAARIFERAGWKWGGPPDYVHFQVGLPLIEKWSAAGELSSN